MPKPAPSGKHTSSCFAGILVAIVACCKLLINLKFELVVETSEKNVHSSPRSQPVADITLEELIARREQQQREVRAAQLEAAAESLAEAFAEAFISSGKILDLFIQFCVDQATQQEKKHFFGFYKIVSQLYFNNSFSKPQL